MGDIGLMGKIFAISDIHGHYEEFVMLMKKIGYEKGKDRLVILGDMVDVGPESIKLLSLLRSMSMQYPDTVKILRGNHDNEFLKIIKMLAKAETLNEEGWAAYAKFTGDDLETLCVYENLFGKNDKLRLIEWLDNLPLYYEEGPYIFVHAGVDPRLPLNIQPEQIMLWGKDGKSNPFYKIKSYPGRVVIFGHTPTRIMHNLNTGEYNNHIWFDLKNYDKIGIDCCVWSGGTLGALEINTETDQYTEHYL